MHSFKTISAGLLFGCSLAMGQGFTGGVLSKLNPWATPDFAYLTRKLPPIISELPGKKVSFEASAASSSVPQDVLTVLVTRTKAEILKDRERGITLEERNPDVRLQCQVTSWELTEQNRTETVGNNTRQLKRIIGNVAATVVILNGQSQTSLDSENLIHHYEEEFDVASGMSNHWWKNVRAGKSGGRIPTPDEQRSLLMEGLAKKIAQRVVPIKEEVAIALPKGKKFSEIKTLAENKRWGQVLEVAEKMEPFREPDDDAYRQYIIGVGHEAMAYTQAQDPKAIQDELSRAQTQYSKAKETNRGEKKFLDPDMRVQESLDHVIKLIAISAGVKGEPAPAPTAAPTEFNNDYLVHLFKSLRRSEKFIINQIETANDPKFDDSPAGQDFLFKQGLSEDVVMAVSKRMSSERGKKSGTAADSGANRVVGNPAPATPPAAPAATTPTTAPTTTPSATTTPRTPPAKKQAPAGQAATPQKK